MNKLITLFAVIFVIICAIGLFTTYIFKMAPRFASPEEGQEQQRIEEDRERISEETQADRKRFMENYKHQMEMYKRQQSSVR